MKRTVITSLFLLPGLLILQACSGNTENQGEETHQHPLVKFAEVQRGPFTHEIKVQGNVETDQDITLSSEMGGLITSIEVKEGQRVSAGQVIAQIDASVLSSNLVELNTKLEYAEYMLDKQKELMRRGVGSEFDLETAQNNVDAIKASIKSLSTQKGKAVIRAPFSGTIDQVFARQGQMAGPASPIARLVNNKTIDIVASISEKHFSKVKEGTEMRVSFPNYADTTVILPVSHVGNYIAPTNRTFRIKSTLNNNDYFLPNMLAEVRITDLSVENGLIIPSLSILKDQENNDFVYLAKEHKKEGDTPLYEVNKVLVTVIEKFKGRALIAEGSLKEGEFVVVEGARGITSKDIVRNK